jgi:hypothetical protein
VAIIFAFFCPSSFLKRCVFVYVYSVSLIECAGSVGISLAGRVMYMSRVCLRLWSAGPVRVYLGTVVVWTAGLYGFSFLWLCSGGYSTGEMVRGGGSFFPFLSLVCRQFSWRLDICGRNFVLYIF